MISASWMMRFLQHRFPHSDPVRTFLIRSVEFGSSGVLDLLPYAYYIVPLIGRWRPHLAMGTASPTSLCKEIRSGRETRRKGGRGPCCGMIGWTSIPILWVHTSQVAELVSRSLVQWAGDDALAREADANGVGPRDSDLPHRQGEKCGARIHTYVCLRPCLNLIRPSFLARWTSIVLSPSREASRWPMSRRGTWRGWSGMLRWLHGRQREGRRRHWSASGGGGEGRMSRPRGG